jgi:beta-galactosidase/beta-glucuronidase
MNSKAYIPRAEHPRPQFQRESWLNLNGVWTFAFDFGQSGAARDWQKSAGFEGRITVPFCPESNLSGVAHTDFIPEIWYQRLVTVPDDWQGRKIIFHCGGIDYSSEIYVDGVLGGQHTGGSSPIDWDITELVKPGQEQSLVIRAVDDLRSGVQAFGKQCPHYKSRGCSYTRTTGIWQTPWLEAVHPSGLQSCRIVPDFDNDAFAFTPRFFEATRGCRLTVRVSEGGKIVAEETSAVANGVTRVLTIPGPKPWSPSSPHLYDVELTVSNASGEVIDRVQSYAGLRKFHIEGDRIYLNNERIYLRLVLDQGFYPDGIWTAPSDDALRQDIELAMAAGFNGARLHQKVFESRFHYWADKLGYLTWSEFSDWGIGFWEHFTRKLLDYHHALRDFLAQWTAVVEDKVNHPSIIAWTPFNETADYKDLEEHRRIMRDVYDLTKALDPTRPVNESSGWVHAKTDLWTAHNYAEDAAKLKAALDTAPIWCTFPDIELQFYHGQPYLLDEWGGVRFIPEGTRPFADNSWGYGRTPMTAEQALARIRAVQRVLVEHPKVQGYCYTQLTDIEQEQNGVYNYDRTPKFDMDKVRAIFSDRPAWSRW